MTRSYPVTDEPQIDLTLKPCPFCGGSKIHDLKNFDWVACEDCGAQIEDGEPSAPELWNRRAPQPASVAKAARNDIGILLSALHQFEEAVGETFDDEGGDIAAIEREFAA